MKTLCVSLALVLTAVAAAPVAAHELCPDHGRECRWQEAAQALCILDQAAANYTGMGIGEDNEDLREIRAQIAHHETDLRAHVEKLEGFAARLETERGQAEDRRRRAAEVLDRTITDRDRMLAEMPEVANELAKDTCGLTVTLVQAPLARLTETMRHAPGNTARARAIVDGISGLFPMACGESALHSVEELAVHTAIREMAVVLEHVPLRINAVLHISAAYLHTQQLQRLATEVQDNTEIAQLYVRWEMHQAAAKARANDESRKNAGKEIEAVRRAIERRGCR